MINIEASIGVDHVFTLTAEGHAHADRNENDHDLVCCAVSTIICTLANSCAQMEDVNTVYHSKHGYGHVNVTSVPEDLWGEIVSRFQMAVDGLTVLALQYPDSIKIDHIEQ